MSGDPRSLIEQERKDSSCQICQRVSDKRKDGGEDRVARTERESDSRRRQEKWQTCWWCRDQQRACRMAQASAEKLELNGPAEKERVASVPQREQLASKPKPPLPKGEGTEYRIMRGGETQDGREPHLGERGGSKREHGEKKDGLHSEGTQIPRRTGRASNESLPRTSRRKHERMIGRKSSSGRSAESWFHSKSSQT